jgi:ribosomal protein S18 acetylase RimI-like enzyme
MADIFFVRPAETGDRDIIFDFLQKENSLQHRHLDWQLPIDWLGTRPFWILGKNQSVIAALAFPDDPPGVFWVRLFAAMDNLRLSQTWKLLFEKALIELHITSGTTIASVAVQEWYLDVLKNNNFVHLHDIVVLQRSASEGRLPTVQTDELIEPMTAKDLSLVEEIDTQCFKPLWQNSMTVTSKAYQTSAYSTVVKVSGKVVAYQICSATPFNAHLARIAVLPAYQGSGIGYMLIQDLVNYFYNIGIKLITVNTQSTNQASLSLYRKVGFFKNGERFPVMVYTIP